MLIIPCELRPSSIHGFGVFACDAVRAGQIVSRYMPPFDVQYPKELLVALSPAEHRYLKNFSYLSLFSGVYVLPGDYDRYMNHSVAPNVGMNPNWNTENLALRDITSGEELTCDYRTFDAEWREKLQPTRGVA